MNYCFLNEYERHELFDTLDYYFSDKSDLKMKICADILQSIHNKEGVSK